MEPADRRAATRRAPVRGTRASDPGARVQIELRQVNGQPGAMLRDADRRLINVFVLDIADGLVQAVRSVINPDKLRHLGPVADARELARKARHQTELPE
jgi:RNA polymerase sigma-70 factor (ECF subfamily)